MRQTIVGVFDSDATARRVAATLHDAGYVAQLSEATQPVTSAVGTDSSDGESGVLARIGHFFGHLFQDDPAPFGHYAEAVRRGHVLVKVDVDNDRDVEMVKQAMDDSGAIDIDEQSRAWGRGGMSQQQDAFGQRQALAAEEQAALDLRTAQMAGARVYAYTAAFDTEEPPHLWPSERIEGDPHDYDRVAALFRDDHAKRFADEVGTYEQLEPAYRHGWALRRDDRYAGRGWDDIEPDVQRDWETRHPGSAWARMKESIRHAWERVVD